MSPTDEIGNMFADALTEIVMKCSGMSLETLSAEPETGFDSVVGFMSLTGKHSGMIFISSREDDIRVVCSFMTGIPLAEVTRTDIDDALGELVNMTAGIVKRRLSEDDYMFVLSVPTVLRGDNMTAVVKKRVNSVSRLLGNGEVAFRLRVLYFN